MSDLHVFRFDGGITETVIASSIADAWAVIKESIGHDRSDYEEENDVDFVQLPDDHVFALCIDGTPTENGFPNDDGWRKKRQDGHFWRSERTCAEWVSLAGRGHLGSSEW